MQMPHTSLAIEGIETAISKPSPFSLKAITETSTSIFQKMEDVGEAQTVTHLLAYIRESVAVQGMLRIDIGHVLYNLKKWGTWRSLTGAAGYENFRDWCKRSEIGGTIDYDEVVFAISCYETAVKMEDNQLSIEPLLSTNMTALKLGLVRRQVNILTEETRQAVLNGSYTPAQRDAAITHKRTEVEREITSILALDQGDLKGLAISANAPPGALEPAYMPFSNGRIVNGRVCFDVSFDLSRETLEAIRAHKVNRKFHMRGHDDQMNAEEFIGWLDENSLIREPTVIDAAQ